MCSICSDAERAEDDDVVHAIEEFRLEVLPQRVRALPSPPRDHSSFAASRMYAPPMFDVMMITVFRKSTVRPCCR